MCVYQDNGYSDRNDYFDALSHEYGLDVATIEAIADSLGPNEDFDGLVSHLEDYFG